MKTELTIGAIAIATVIAIMLLINSSATTNYDDINPHLPKCVQGAVLQPDGSCIDQENN